ncbi:MAG: IS66 family transposase [Candidatus Omnitrophica bacterium]|nr:IS66 family transposase [Candidatus Omnitrophota bacterium]
MSWLRSIDEGKRKLRSHLARVKAAHAQQKAARKKLSADNIQLQDRIVTLEEEVKRLRDELEEMQRQRDKYRSMVFKENKKQRQESGAADKEQAAIEAGGSGEKRRRGGKPGHAGHGWKVPERIDDHKRVYLNRCPICGEKLERGQRHTVHIVEDIPAPEQAQSRVTEYELEEHWCGHCKRMVKAQPAGVIAGSRFGINLILFVMMQKYGAKSSWPAIVALLRKWFNVQVSAGALVAMMHRVRQWMGPRYDMIREQIAQSAVTHADETSWRVDGINKWLWGFFTKTAAYYVVEDSRGKGVPQQILNDAPEGQVLVHDDYGGYQKLPGEHQSCWAHLLRVSHGAARNEKSSAESVALHAELKQMYIGLSRIIEQPYKLRQRRQQYRRYREQIGQIIARCYRAKDAQRIQSRIAKQRTNLLTVLLHQNVPLTNNLAERCLRPLVVCRKISGGSRSDAGAKTQAVNMSILETIKLQDQPVIPTLAAYILDACKKN